MPKPENEKQIPAHSGGDLFFLAIWLHRMF